MLLSSRIRTGLVKTLFIPNNSQMLQLLIIRLLARLDSAPTSGIPPGTNGFERFVRLAPSRFNDIAREKAYDFLTRYHDRLFNLGILEAHGVSYTSMNFQEWPRNTEISSCL
ncbi:hypothetical protein R3W88_019367 [Solanum pinnatisectum]|uniref:Uncharacterized protein n=1 Tax=Solanum pinnatisectum TaxID=50273 RepID=A0AAV9KLG3_9SOLN|nr:hypothetical protein R3W88_019367 [Solanum pinnatisectum]